MYRKPRQEPLLARLRPLIATVASVLLPGLGHAVYRLGKPRTAALFLVPSLVGIAALLCWWISAGTFVILAAMVSPAALTVIAIANMLIAVWRGAAGADALRRTHPGKAALAAAAAVLVIGVGVPHVLIAQTVSSAADYLDSTFANVEPTPQPSATPPATNQPTAGPTDSGALSGGPSPSPTYEIAPFPTDGGNGTLPAFNADVPWQRPGAIPWGDDGRFDLLLLGSDAGSDRWSRRADVMLLVEVDVATGKVAMIGLPRNMQYAPYPAGPARNASACGCQPGLLNEMYVEATARHPGQWPGSGAVKGIGAVRAVVSEVTGRPIDAVLIADLEAVIRVVDAMGGIDINVPDPVHDSHYPDPGRGSIVLDIPAGQQHFDGRTALAYARSRHQDSDYGRMDRQQTLILAIRDQIGPQTFLDAPALFGAAKGAAWTDLPRESLPSIIELFGKAAHAQVKQLRLVPPKYPSYMTAAWITRVRQDVAALLPGTAQPAVSKYPLPYGKPKPAATPTPAPGTTPTPTDTPVPGTTPTPEPTVPPPPPTDAPSPSP
jgi:LCP family protein required for cell wall assembly